MCLCIYTQDSRHGKAYLNKNNRPPAVDGNDRALEHHVVRLHLFHLRPRLLVLDSADGNLDL